MLSTIYRELQLVPKNLGLSELMIGATFSASPEHDLFCFLFPETWFGGAAEPAHLRHIQISLNLRYS